jgi:hypothetical protein
MWEAVRCENLVCASDALTLTNTTETIATLNTNLVPRRCLCEWHRHCLAAKRSRPMKPRVLLEQRCTVHLALVDRWFTDFRLSVILQAEWVATILLREDRASGCFGEARKTRCKTRHEKGNVTRMLGGRSRKLLKEWLLRLDSNQQPSG